MKKRLLCPHLPTRGTPTVLAESEAHHAIRVLRLRDGEIVEAMDGAGHRALATLRIRGGHPRIEFLDSDSSTTALRQESTPFPLILEMAVLKGDAMEWVVEKSVELGVQQLIPILTDYTVVQMKSKSPEFFQERWQKIADQALKQCGRLDRMEIQIPLSLESLLTKTIRQKSPTDRPTFRLWCDEASAGESDYLLTWLNSHYEKTAIIRTLVGPEGGWSTHERTILMKESQASPMARIDLGPRILRAETAALFSVSVISAHIFAASH